MHTPCSVTELNALLKTAAAARLLDVRERWEREICQIPSAVHIPLAQLPARLHELDQRSNWVVYCHHGMRSQMAVELMLTQGFPAARNLTGGIAAWAAEVDPAMPQY